MKNKVDYTALAQALAPLVNKTRYPDAMLLAKITVPGMDSCSIDHTGFLLYPHCKVIDGFWAVCEACLLPQVSGDPDEFRDAFAELMYDLLGDGYYDDVPFTQVVQLAVDSLLITPDGTLRFCSHRYVREQVDYLTDFRDPREPVSFAKWLLDEPELLKDLRQDAIACGEDPLLVKSDVYGDFVFLRGYEDKYTRRTFFHAYVDYLYHSEDNDQTFPKEMIDQFVADGCRHNNGDDRMLANTMEQHVSVVARCFVNTFLAQSKKSD